MDLKERLELLGTFRDWYWKQKEENTIIKDFMANMYKAFADCYSACEIAIQLGYEDEWEMLDKLFITWDNMSGDEYSDYKGWLAIALGILNWKEEIIIREEKFMEEFDNLNKEIEISEEKLNELVKKLEEGFNS